MSLPDLQFSKADKRHPLYNTWWHMLSRCYLPPSPGFDDYGQRGIAVCERWLAFATFAADIGGVKPKGMSLDRRDNDGGYSPENCKWSTRSDQMLNRRQFGNNSSGATGVVRIATRFEARFHADSVRYRIGRYDTLPEAKRARAEFIKLFAIDRAAAIASIDEPTVWCTSTTDMRGVNKHKDGGYTVRVTVAGTRHYVGYFKTISEAIDARCEFDKSGN